MSDDILSVVYLLLVLALVLPGFIYMNKNKKTFLKNLFFLGCGDWNYHVMVFVSKMRI